MRSTLGATGPGEACRRRAFAHERDLRGPALGTGQLSRQQPTRGAPALTWRAIVRHSACTRARPRAWLRPRIDPGRHDPQSTCRTREHLSGSCERRRGNGMVAVLVARWLSTWSECPRACSRSVMNRQDFAQNPCDLLSECLTVCARSAGSVIRSVRVISRVR